MPQPPRTIRYDGLFPSQTRERFQADAERAAHNDWYPDTETWHGTELEVTYVHDPGRHEREQAAAAVASASAAPGRATTDLLDPADRSGSWGWGSTPGRVIAGLLMGVVLVAVVGVTMGGMGMFDRGPAATRPPDVIVPVVNLGPRAEAVAVLGSLGFTGTLGTLPDGRERWLGTEPGGATAEVIGPAPGIAEVALTLPPTHDTATTTTLGAFLTRFGPATRTWIGTDVRPGEVRKLTTTLRRFGDLIVEVTEVAAEDGPRLRVSLRAATSTDDRVPRALTVHPQGRSTPTRRFGDGAWQVGRDISPGTYRASGGVDCYWARLDGLGGSLHDIIEDGRRSGSPVVTIKRSDTGFESQGCGVWSPK
ncbi:MAG: hypothetical protein KF809_16460 [Chloroflexi bacterium]|nr:hypothetical protein [Chloroflexota bacterium]